MSAEEMKVITAKVNSKLGKRARMKMIEDDLTWPDFFSAVLQKYVDGELQLRAGAQAADSE